jgi:hypothetical protein
MNCYSEYLFEQNVSFAHILPMLNEEAFFDSRISFAHILPTIKYPEIDFDDDKYVMDGYIHFSFPKVLNNIQEYEKIILETEQAIRDTILKKNTKLNEINSMYDDKIREKYILLNNENNDLVRYKENLKNKCPCLYGHENFKCIICNKSSYTVINPDLETTNNFADSYPIVAKSIKEKKNCISEIVKEITKLKSVRFDLISHNKNNYNDEVKKQIKKLGELNKILTNYKCQFAYFCPCVYGHKYNKCILCDKEKSL